MTDPIQSQAAQRLAPTALLSGSSSALKGGTQLGTVVSMQAEGKAVVSFQGRMYTAETQGADLKAGQQVLARLVGDRLVLDLSTTRNEPAASAPAIASRTLAAILSNLGVSGTAAEVIARALMQAGIPLDKTALKELAQVLPNLQPESAAALSFMFSRGLPISESLVSILTQLFGPKPKLSETTEKLISSLVSWDEDLEQEESAAIPSEVRQKLKELRENLEQLILPLRSQSDPKNKENLEALFRALLASPEAQIQNPSGSHKNPLGETLVRLLSLLMDLSPIVSGTDHNEKVAELVKQATLLHETLAGQAAQNLPSIREETPPVLFFQIPFRDGQETKELEVRYRAKDREGKSGTLDLRLDLSKLGPMHIAIGWDQTRLSLRFLVEDASAAEHLKSGMEELRKALLQQGFLLETVGVHVGEVPDTLRPEEPSGIQSKFTGFDIRV